MFSSSSLCITFIFVVMGFSNLCIPSVEALSNFYLNNQGRLGATNLWRCCLKAELHLGIIWDFLVEPIGSIGLRKILSLRKFAPKFFLVVFCRS